MRIPYRDETRQGTFSYDSSGKEFAKLQSCKANTSGEIQHRRVSESAHLVRTILWEANKPRAEPYRRSNFLCFFARVHYSLSSSISIIRDGMHICCLIIIYRVDTTIRCARCVAMQFKLVSAHCLQCIEPTFTNRTWFISHSVISKRPECWFPFSCAFILK